MSAHIKEILRADLDAHREELDAIGYYLDEMRHDHLLAVVV